MKKSLVVLTACAVLSTVLLLICAVGLFAVHQDLNTIITAKQNVGRQTTTTKNTKQETTDSTGTGTGSPSIPDPATFPSEPRKEEPQLKVPDPSTFPREPRKEEPQLSSADRPDNDEPEQDIKMSDEDFMHLLTETVEDAAAKAGFDTDQAANYLLEVRGKNAGEVRDAFRTRDVRSLNYVFAHVLKINDAVDSEHFEITVEPFSAVSTAKMPEKFIAHGYTTHYDTTIEAGDLVVFTCGNVDQFTMAQNRPPRVYVYDVIKKQQDWPSPSANS